MNWYRNTRRSRYHLAREDWVTSGMAECGVKIPSPAFVLEKGQATGIFYRLRCGNCRKIEVSRAAREAEYYSRKYHAHTLRPFLG